MRDGKFASISSVSGLDFNDDSRALALCDWDFDGKLDLWMSARTAPRIRFLRNQSSNTGHFIAIQLRGNGTTTNKDAIGARVEVISDAKEKSILTLHAGDGFLTQSSRWLHFGLGEIASVKAIQVDWPGGKRKVYRNVAADSFYIIHQDSGKATPWKPLAARSPIQVQQQLVPVSSQIARVIPPYHLPLPSIDYVLGSSTNRLKIESPTMVTVWSSSCVNCIRELGIWSRAADAFRQQGLEVVAINADIDATSAEIVERETMLNEMGFAFTSLTPTTDTVRSIDLFQRALMDLWRPMPVPCSFLLDRYGRVVAIYKGPVDLEQVWADMKLFGADAERIEELALPFAGRRGSAYPKADPLRVAAQMVDRTQVSGAIDYLQHFLDTSARAGHEISNVKQTDIQYMRSVLLASAGRNEESLRALELCRSLNPKDFRARADLAQLYLKQKNLSAAEIELFAVVQINPKDIASRRNLSATLLQQEKFSDAIQQLELLLQQTPQDAMAHFNLGNALRKTGQWERSLESFRAAYKYRPTSVLAANTLAWIMATHPNEKLRDGKAAMRIAEEMCKQTKFQQPTLLDTLAAAYAETGEFDKAVATSTRAIELLESNPKTKQDSSIMQQRKALYLKRQAFRDEL